MVTIMVSKWTDICRLVIFGVCVCIQVCLGEGRSGDHPSVSASTAAGCQRDAAHLSDLVRWHRHIHLQSDIGGRQWFPQCALTREVRDENPLPSSSVLCSLATLSFISSDHFFLICSLPALWIVSHSVFQYPCLSPLIRPLFLSRCLHFFI